MILVVGVADHQPQQVVEDNVVLKDQRLKFVREVTPSADILPLVQREKYDKNLQEGCRVC
jgi:hypothetical protein